MIRDRKNRDKNWYMSDLSLDNHKSTPVRSMHGISSLSLFLFLSLQTRNWAHNIDLGAPMQSIVIKNRCTFAVSFLLFLPWFSAFSHHNRLNRFIFPSRINKIHSPFVTSQCFYSILLRFWSRRKDDRFLQRIIRYFFDKTRSLIFYFHPCMYLYTCVYSV